MGVFTEKSKNLYFGNNIILDLLVLLNNFCKKYKNISNTQRSLNSIKTELRGITDFVLCSIDYLLSQSINHLLHEPSFQKIEASWRGLKYLVTQAAEIKNINIRVLNVSWNLITQDLQKALDFDQSQLFKKIYDEEFGMAGGKPFGLLIGDYYLHHKPHLDSSTNDITTLQSLSQICAAAFVPFVTSISPLFFNLGNYAALAYIHNLQTLIKEQEYQRWKKLRQSEDSCFIGLVLPRILMRCPYRHEENSLAHEFIFEEEIRQNDSTNYLWGNGCYALAAVTLQAFSESGWFFDMQGAPLHYIGGGVIKDLPRERYHSDHYDINLNPSVETVFPFSLQNRLSKAGFLPLSDLKYTPYSVLYNLSSVQEPNAYTELIAEKNAQLATMLHYILCVSRFAHYLKVLIRDKIGIFTSAEELEDFLRQWLLKYTIANDKLSKEQIAKYPLRASHVQIKQEKKFQGSYYCFIYLQTHLQFDPFKIQFPLKDLGKSFVL